eukprot:m.238615 g.238615  ORF g.238615 m.238615 type:complete len:169 (-) comp21892_c0_seq1:229-735(-)
MDLPGRVASKSRDDEEDQAGNAADDEDGQADEDRDDLELGADEEEEAKMREQYKHLLDDSMTEEQFLQYKAFRNTKLPKAEVKKVMRAAGVTTQTPSDNVVNVMGGITKVFIAQIIEAARQQVPPEQPLEPRHIRAALRQLRALGHDPSVTPAYTANLVGRRRGVLWR